MRRSIRQRLSPAFLIALVALAPATTAASEGHTGRRAVTAWAQRTADPLATTAPAAPLDDLAPLRRSVGNATVVGLGESVHGAAEEIALKHRTLRFLVEELGFRSVAWEEDWTTGVEIDDYIRGRSEDLEALMERVSPQYQYDEVGDVLRWLRDFNAGRADPVRFVGVEHYFTRQTAYDTVDAYVAAAAPERRDELRSHLGQIEPTSADPFEHIDHYRAVDNKQPHLDHANAVRDLVAAVAHEPGDRTHAAALHAAGQILAFHEFHALSPDEAWSYREIRAAESLRWWQELTGDRVAYWAASAHTVNAADLRIVGPGTGEMRFPSAGSHLRAWFGDAYLSVGFTLDHGTVALGGGEIAALSQPDPQWFEHPLGAVDHDQFVIDLRRPGPTPVRRWLHEPATTRGPGPGTHVTGGTLADWFDVLVHRQQVTAASSTTAH